MAEFAIEGDGHVWNNNLAHATFEDNVATHGKETALKFLRQDIRSWISERKNESHQWSLYARDGHMMTETGVSLDEMTNNITNGPHSDLVPENIKATAHLEAATLREATRLAAMGANRIVFPEQHMDTSGNIVSRYLSVWTKSTSDPTRFDGTRIDLGKNFLVEDVRTGSSFTAFQHQGDIAFHQHGVEKQAFVLEVKDSGGEPLETVEKAIITSIHRSHQELYAHDIRVADTSLLDRRERIVESEVRNVQNEAGYQNRRTEIYVHIPRAVLRDTIPMVRGVERLTLEKTREKPVSVVEVIEKRHRKMRKEVAAITLIAETGIAVHAAPFILAVLSEKLPLPIRAVEKSVRRHKGKELRIKNKELRRTAKREPKQDSVKVQPVRSERVEPLGAAKERKRRKKRSKENGGPPRRAAAEKLTPIRIKKPMNPEGRRFRQLRRVMKSAERILGIKQMPKKEKKLWMALVVAAGEFNPTNPAKRDQSRQAGPVRPIHETMRKWSNKKIEDKRREMIAGAQFAWMVWVMLNRANFPPVESKSAMLVSERRGVKLIHPSGVEHESSPWVLLSIVWYLTAIREQGMKNYPVKKKRRTLPRQGIIFAFAS